MARPKSSINKKEGVKKVTPIINTPRVITPRVITPRVIIVSNHFKIENELDPSLPESKQRWLR